MLYDTLVFNERPNDITVFFYGKHESGTAVAFFGEEVVASWRRHWPSSAPWIKVRGSGGAQANQASIPSESA